MYYPPLPQVYAVHLLGELVVFVFNYLQIVFAYEEHTKQVFFFLTNTICKYFIKSIQVFQLKVRSNIKP